MTVFKPQRIDFNGGVDLNNITKIAFTDEYIYVLNISKNKGGSKLFQKKKSENISYCKNHKEKIVDSSKDLCIYKYNGEFYILIIDSKNAVKFIEEKSFSEKEFGTISYIKDCKSISSSDDKRTLVIANRDHVWIYEGVGFFDRKYQKDVRNDGAYIFDDMICVFTKERFSFYLWKNHSLTEIKGISELEDKKFKKFDRIFPMANLGQTGKSVILGIIKDGENINFYYNGARIKFFDNSTFYYIFYKKPFIYCFSSNLIEVYSDNYILLFSGKVNLNPNSVQIVVLPDYSFLICDKKIILQYNMLSSIQDILKKFKDVSNWDYTLYLCESFKGRFDNQKDRAVILMEYMKHKLSTKKYLEAIDVFKKSKEHPLQFLMNFETFYQIQSSEEIQNDLDEHLKLINDALNVLHISGNEVDNSYDINITELDINELISCLKRLYNFENVNENFTESYVRENVKHLARKVTISYNGIQDTKNMLNMLNTRNAKNYIKVPDMPVELENFIYTFLTNEPDITLQKIYNTFRLKWLVHNKKSLSSFLSSNPPLFFGSTEAILVTEKLIAEYKEICKRFDKHENCINYFLQNNNIDETIEYITNCGDAVTQIVRFFKDIYERVNGDVGTISKIFHIPKISSEASTKLKHFIDRTSIDNKVKNILIINLYEYVVYDRESTDRLVHGTVIEKYINLAKENFKSPFPTLIQNDGSETSKYRNGLLRILQESEYYTPYEIFKLIKDYFIDESFVCARKDNNLNYPKAKIFDSNNYTFEEKLKMVSMINEPSIYIDFFRSLNEKEKIVSFLNKCPDSIEIETVFDIISDNFAVCDIKEYLSHITTNVTNLSRVQRLKSFVLDKLIEDRKKQLSRLKGGYVRVTDSLRCCVCGKTIRDSIFCLLLNNTVVHESCRENIPQIENFHL